MTPGAFARVLAENPAAPLHRMLSDGAFVPAQFHVTGVGRVRKDVIDCGGAVRSSPACVRPGWAADDTGHRLDTTTLAGILRLAAPVLTTADLPVEVEYEGGRVSQFPAPAAEVTPSGVLFHLGVKHTACLAPDKCGVEQAGPSGGPPPGCC